MSKVTSGLLDKLRGSMIGAVIGDCLGAPVECTYWDGIPLAKCASRFQDIYQVPSQTVYEYTDDTAMARQVAESIITKQNVDPKDMAQRFVKEYHQHPRRGYGGIKRIIYYINNQSSTYYSLISLESNISPWLAGLNLEFHNKFNFNFG